MVDNAGSASENIGRGRPKSSRLRRWLIGVGIGIVAVLALTGGAVEVAEYKTRQPEFCASCHIMEAYYQTWEADIHGGKLGIECVECHYAPGERTTIKAKFRGLSQATSYFSGRYGATRPRAHVSDLSCTTAKCHGDNRFMDKPILMGTVKFVHSHHLQHDDSLEEPKQRELLEIEGRLRASLGEHFEELESVAKDTGPGEARHDKMVEMCRKWNVEVDRNTLVSFSDLHHRPVRIAQLKDLQCTNCHSYNAQNRELGSNRGDHHFQVSTSTCFTCHFNNAGFNSGTNTCLMCHTPPQQEIVVHAESGATGTETLGTSLVKMNHTQILANNVGCISCHADALREDSDVTRRDCERCHDQPRFLKDWKDPPSLEMVTQYHSVHITQQRAKCVDCHSEIKHKLLPDGGDSGNGFFASVLSKCTQCHPNHHASQVNLLLGRGGNSVPKSAPNLMFGSRTNCTGCHVELSHDAHGSNVVKATQDACIACHGDRHSTTFEKWKQGLELVLEDAEQAYSAARKRFDEQIDAPPDAREKAAKLLDAARDDLILVKSGNGLHNVTYAMELLDGVMELCRKASAALAGN